MQRLRGRRRQPRGASRTGEASRPSKTVPRPAPLGPQLASALTAPLHRCSGLLGSGTEERADELGRGRWNRALPGYPWLGAFLTLEGSGDGCRRRGGKKLPQRPGKPLHCTHPPTRAPGPLLPETRPSQPGVYKVKESVVSRSPPPPPPSNPRQASLRDAARQLASVLHLEEELSRSGHPTETDKRSPAHPPPPKKNPYNSPKGAGGRTGSRSLAPSPKNTFISSLISLFTG